VPGAKVRPAANSRILDLLSGLVLASSHLRVTSAEFDCGRGDVGTPWPANDIGEGQFVVAAECSGREAEVWPSDPEHNETLDGVRTCALKT